MAANDAFELLTDEKYRHRLREVHGLLSKLEKTPNNTQLPAQASRYVGEVRVESSRVESSRVESSRVESSRVESSRVESSRVQSSQVKSSQVKSSQVKSSQLRREVEAPPALGALAVREDGLVAMDWLLEARPRLTKRQEVLGEADARAAGR